MGSKSPKSPKNPVRTGREILQDARESFLEKVGVEARAGTRVGASREREEVEGGEEDSAHLPTMKVRFEDIVVDHGFNSRKDYKRIGELASEIRERGLIAPFVVHRNDAGTYDLDVGFRRYLAVTSLREEADKEVKESGEARASLPFDEVEVKLYEGPELGRWFLNLSENLSREDLHPWEIGDHCLRIRDRFQMSGAEIAERVRYDKSHVNNCMRIVERIDKDVQAAFRNGQANPPFNLLTTLASLVGRDGQPDHERQRQKWTEWMTGTKPRKGRIDPETGEEDEEPRVEGKMRRLREASRVLARLEDGLSDAVGEAEQEYFRGAVAATRYLMGLASKMRKVNLAKALEPPGRLKKDEDGEARSEYEDDDEEG